MGKTKSQLISLPAVLLASLVLPPVGIVLWWLRPWGSGWLRRSAAVIGRIAVTLALLVLTVTYLVRFKVVHMELSGAGYKPMFSLRSPEADQAALERHRAAQARSALAKPAPSPVEKPSEEPPSQPELKTAPAAATPAKPEIAAPALSAGSAWTDFRGPNRAAVYTEGEIMTSWPTGGLRPLWKQPVGGGYASFVIANGKAFTIEQRRDQEVVAAYEIASGREIWINGWKTLFSESLGGDGPRATPIWDEGRLYALGAAGEFRCYASNTGTVLWSKNILKDSNATNLTWGMSASPLVVDDQVVVAPGGRGRSVTAYNKRTGQFLWGALDDKAAYSSPILTTVAGQRQIVIVTGTRLVGLAVEGGKLLWEYPWITANQINCAQPVVVDSSHIFVSSGYDHGSALVEVDRKDGSYSVRTVWENKNLKNRFNSSVLFEGHIYGFDEGIFACIDALTGERKWKGGRYGYGQMILAGNHIILLTESGDLALLKATPDSLQEVARFEAISGKTWNVPAISGGILLVRNAREMAAFKVAP